MNILHQAVWYTGVFVFALVLAIRGHSYEVRDDTKFATFYFAFALVVIVLALIVNNS